MSFLLKHYSGLLNDNKISDKADARTFPPSLYILAVCSPFQGKVGNAEILKLLLDQHFDAINLKDREGKLTCLYVLKYSTSKHYVLENIRKLNVLQQYRTCT